MSAAPLLEELLAAATPEARHRLLEQERFHSLKLAERLLLKSAEAQLPSTEEALELCGSLGSVPGRSRSPEEDRSSSGRALFFAPHGRRAMQGGMFAELGRTLRALRESRGFSQAELARKAGLGKSQVSKYERGKELPQLGTLEKLLDALGAEPLALFYTAHLFR